MFEKCFECPYPDCISPCPLLKEEGKNYSRTYYQKNKEKMKKYRKQYYLKNKQKILEQQKKKYQNGGADVV